MPSTWTIDPNQVVTRAQVAQLYGGATQGGIQPSASSPNVLVYTDPAVGDAYGYSYDGWEDKSEQVFYYTGEGQQGDQPLIRGNLALATHRESGRTLRLFEAIQEPSQPGGRRHRYVGEFAVDSQHPYRREEAPDRDGLARTVLVFRLVAQTDQLTDSAAGVAPEPATAARVDLIPSEKNAVAQFDIAARGGTSGERRESTLMADLEAHLRGLDHHVARLSVVPPGHSRPLLTDTFDDTTRTLYEVKGTATRSSVRQAIAQLLDYRRHVQPEHCIVVLPVVPADDLLDLIHSCGFKLVVPTGRTFRLFGPD